MAIGTTAALIGSAAIGAAGSAYSASKQSSAAKKAANASQFNPWDISGLGGNVSFDRLRNSASANLSPEQQALYQQLLGGAGQQFGGGGYGGFLQPFFEQGAGGSIPGLFNQSQAAAGQLPTGATNQFLGGTFGREALANQLGAGFLGQAAGQQFQTNPFAQQALQQGFGAFGTPDAPDFQQTMQDRLGLLREQAQPFEQQQVMGELNSQFGRGIKDASAGFNRQEALSRGLAQADTSRQLDAMGFAQGLRQQEQGNVLAQRQLGLGMAGQGFGAQSNDFRNQLAQQGLWGQLGMGLMGQGQQFGGAGYGAQLGMNDLTNQRAMQRLQQAQQMFGFGQQNQQQNFNLGMGMLGGAQSMDQQLMNMLATGGNLGGAQATAGANAGQFMVQGSQNNMGDFFAGLGGGLFNSAMQGGGGLFGGATNQQGMPNVGYNLPEAGLPGGFTNQALFPGLFGG